jgi:hypothetical protein
MKLLMFLIIVSQDWELFSGSGDDGDFFKTQPWPLLQVLMILRTYRIHFFENLKRNEPVNCGGRGG